MWQNILSIVKKLSLLVRVVFKKETISKWSNWLAFPSDGYGEIQVTGPFLIREVSYIEVNPIEIRKIGRLVPDKTAKLGTSTKYPCENKAPLRIERGFLSHNREALIIESVS